MIECNRPYPNNPKLLCLRPVGHTENHSTCLGYWPDDDVWEWDHWEDQHERN